MKNTYQEIANSYALWSEYVDPNGLHSCEDFYVMSYADKMRIIEGCFGPEDDAREIDYVSKIHTASMAAKTLFRDILWGEAEIGPREQPALYELVGIGMVRIDTDPEGNETAVISDDIPNEERDEIVAVLDMAFSADEIEELKREGFIE